MESQALKSRRSHLLGDRRLMKRIPEELAYVVDGSGYYAALCVSEDFGCSQWAQEIA